MPTTTTGVALPRKLVEGCTEGWEKPLVWRIQMSLAASSISRAREAAVDALNYELAFSSGGEYSPAYQFVDTPCDEAVGCVPVQILLDYKSVYKDTPRGQVLMERDARKLAKGLGAMHSIVGGVLEIIGTRGPWGDLVVWPQAAATVEIRRTHRRPARVI